MAFREVLTFGIAQNATVYTVATLPDAARTPRGIVVVTDANGGVGTVAFSDGTNWIDVNTGLTVTT